MSSVSQNFMQYGSRFVKSTDGTEIYADACGNRSPGTPILVLIHGAFMVKGVFNPIFEDTKWTSNAFLVRYDTRGHGRSGKSISEEAWHSKRFSEDFESVCKEFEIKEAYVLGWSAGGAPSNIIERYHGPHSHETVASHFADIMTYNHSVKILGLVNVEGGLYRDGSIFKRLMGPLASQYRTILMNPPSVDAFQEALLNFLHLCSEKLSPELFRILLEGMIRQPRGAAAWIHQRTHNPEKMMQEARSGKLPLLAISGGKDKVVVAEEFKAVVEGSGWKDLVYQHLEDADHIPWVSCPEQFRDVVLAWLKDKTRLSGESCVL